MDILWRITQLLIQHLIGSTETKAFKSVNFTVTANKSFKSNRKTSRQTENLSILGQKTFLIFFALTTEKSFAGAANDSSLNTILLQQSSSFCKCANFRSCSNLNYIRIFFLNNCISAMSDTFFIISTCR